MPTVEHFIHFTEAKDYDDVGPMYSIGSWTANNDNTLATTVIPKGVRVTANPFRYDHETGRTMLDRYKALSYNASQPITCGEKYVAKARMGGKIIQPTPLPTWVTDVNDPRLGSVALTVLIKDKNSDAHNKASIIFTNKAIYALLESGPEAITNLKKYSVFSAISKLKSRKQCDVHNLKIEVCQKSGRVKFIADDVRLCSDNIGYQPGKSYNGKKYNRKFTTVFELDVDGTTDKTTDVVAPESVQAGVGMLTLMDMAPFDCTNATGKGYIKLEAPVDCAITKPSTFLYDTTLPTIAFSDDVAVATCYGQGAQMDLHKFGFKISSCKDECCSDSRRLEDDCESECKEEAECKQESECDASDNECESPRRKKKCCSERWILMVIIALFVVIIVSYMLSPTLFTQMDNRTLAYFAGLFVLAGIAIWVVEA